jgi:hypothetical protein
MTGVFCFARTEIETHWKWRQANNQTAQTIKKPDGQSIGLFWFGAISD